MERLAAGIRFVGCESSFRTMAEGANAADVVAEGGQQDASAAANQEPAVKHQLQNSWVLWFDNPVKRVGAKDWSQNLKKVATFDMVEDFWGIFNNIRPPSRLNAGSNYHLFKAGIEPMWEHEENKNGGKWNFTIPRKDAKKHPIDSMWLYTILAMIGENFEAGHELCGAVISLRKGGDRVAVWTKTAEDEKAYPPPPRASSLPPPLPCPISSPSSSSPRIPALRRCNAPRRCMEIGNQFKAALAECLGAEVTPPSPTFPLSLSLSFPHPHPTWVLSPHHS